MSGSKQAADLIDQALRQGAWKGAQQSPVWLRDLPQLIQRLCQKWELTDLQIMTDLSWGLLVSARQDPQKTSVVLKLMPPTSTYRSELSWYQLQLPKAVHLLAFDSDSSALLLERIQPGTRLSSLSIQGDDDKATRVLGELIRQATSRSSTNHEFRHITSLVPALEQLRGQVSDSLLANALATFAELGKRTESDRILHGDLHHDNVLLAQDGSYRLVDPHGYVGPLGFEVGALFRNPKAGSTINLVERRIEILSEILELDRQVIARWGLACTLLSAAWTLEDSGKIPPETLAIAERLGAMT